jgi:hypothetical protein
VRIPALDLILGAVPGILSKVDSLWESKRFGKGHHSLLIESQPMSSLVLRV